MDVNNHLVLLWALSGALLLNAGCYKTDSNLKMSVEPVADKTKLLATIPDAAVQPQVVSPSLGMGLHTPPEPSFQPLFSKLGGGVAYRVETGDRAFVVHNGHAGKNYDVVGDITLSPEGSRIAYGALAGGKWRMVVDGTEGVPFDTVKAPLFSPDGRHLAYQALSGDKWYLVVDTVQNNGTLTRFIDHRFSGDSRSIAFIDNADDYNRSGRLVVSNLAFNQQTIISQHVSRMILGPNGLRLAAISLHDKKQQVVESGFDRPEAVKTGPLYDSVRQLAYAPDGTALAYVAELGNRHFVVFNDREGTLPENADLVEPPVVRPDLKGVGTIISSGNRAFFKQFFLSGDEGTENSYDEVSGLTYNRDLSAHAYAARNGGNWFVVVNGVEGGIFDRVIGPKFSPDGKYLVYRARKDGRRFVVVAKKNGKIIRQHPAYEQVFDLSFTADSKSVAYGVKDGQRLVWRVEPL